MEIVKKKTKKDVWKFYIGKIFIAITKKTIGKRNSTYSLIWKVNGLLKITRKKGMKGIIVGSEFYPGDFTNYSKSKSSFSTVYIKKAIRKGIREYNERREYNDKIDKIPSINV